MFYCEKYYKKQKGNLFDVFGYDSVRGERHLNTFHCEHRANELIDKLKPYAKKNPFPPGYQLAQLKPQQYMLF